MTTHKQPSDRVRVTVATTSRDAKMRKLIEALRKGPMRRPPASDESAHRQAMLDCIERAKRHSEVVA